MTEARPAAAESAKNLRCVSPSPVEIRLVFRVLFRRAVRQNSSDRSGLDHNRTCTHNEYFHFYHTCQYEATNGDHSLYSLPILGLSSGLFIPWNSYSSVGGDTPEMQCPSSSSFGSKNTCPRSQCSDVVQSWRNFIASPSSKCQVSGNHNKDRGRLGTIATSPGHCHSIVF